MSAFKLQNIESVNFTDSSKLNGVSMVYTSGGVSVDGIIVATTGVSAGTLRLTDGSITVAGGTQIDFGSENLITTGGMSANSGMSAGSLVLSSGSITDTGGTITFEDSLVGTGTVDFSGGVSLSGGVSINQFSFPSGLAPVNGNIFTMDANGVIYLTTNGSGGGASGATEINELTDAFANTTNVVLGVSPQNISGSYNVGVGVSALNAITNGERNIALGFDALVSGTSTSDNIAIGYNSLVNMIGGTNSQNVAIGTSTLSALSGDISNDGRNVAIGYLAGQNITGSQNTIVGASAGVSLLTGNNNLILGHAAGPAAGTSSSNNVYLGNGAVSNLYFSGSIIATSDARDKTDVEDSVYGVEFIDRLRPVEYTWNRRHLQSGDDNDNINGKRRVGLIAQELLEIMPNNENEVLNLVNEDNPERYHVGYNNLIPVLVKAVKDLKAEVDTLKQRMDNCSC